MKDILKLYWMLNPFSQKKWLYAICFIGMMMVQASIYLELDRHQLTIGSALFSSYFLFLVLLLEFNFNLQGNVRVKDVLLQTRHAKDFFVKGIMVHSLLLGGMYLIFQMIVFGIMAIFHPIYIEILSVFTWCIMMTILCAICICIGQCNGKRWICVIFIMLYLSVILLFNILSNPLNLNTILVSFTKEPYHLIWLPIVSSCGLLIAYQFGRYCYKTRSEQLGRSYGK